MIISKIPLKKVNTDFILVGKKHEIFCTQIQKLLINFLILNSFKPK